MKKALLLGLVSWLLAAAPVLAYPPVSANVNFASERGVPFGLVLDGRPLTRGMARQVHVDQLMPGQHWADFTVPMAYGGAQRFRSRVWLQPGLETTFVLVMRPGFPLALQQVNAVALYGRGPGYGNNYGSPSGYGNGYPNPSQPYNSPTPYGQGQSGYPAPGGYGNNPTAPNGSNSYPNGSNGYPNGGNNNYPNNGSGYPGSNNGQNGYPNGNNGQNGYPNGNNNQGSYPGMATSSYRTLAPQEINGLMQAVQRQHFDADKLRTAKQALAQSVLPTDDLKRLLLTLDFEASRLELAKFGYDHVSDPQNFERVYDTLNFEASKQELDQAINEQPGN